MTRIASNRLPDCVDTAPLPVSPTIASPTALQKNRHSLSANILATIARALSKASAHVPHVQIRFLSCPMLSSHVRVKDMSERKRYSNERHALQQIAHYAGPAAYFTVLHVSHPSGLRQPPKGKLGLLVGSQGHCAANRGSPCCPCHGSTSQRLQRR